LVKLSTRFGNLGDLSSFLFVSRDEENRLGIVAFTRRLAGGKNSHDFALGFLILSDNPMSCASNSDSESSDTRELLIVYATETGNARSAADFIARQCRRIAFQCRVLNAESISLVGNSIFCISKCPDNI
jgi:hypothetical protein